MCACCCAYSVDMGTKIDTRTNEMKRRKKFINCVFISTHAIDQAEKHLLCDVSMHTHTHTQHNNIWFYSVRSFVSMKRIQWQIMIHIHIFSTSESISQILSVVVVVMLCLIREKYGVDIRKQEKPITLYTHKIE